MIVLQILAGAAAFLIVMFVIAAIISVIDDEKGAAFARRIGQAIGVLAATSLGMALLCGIAYLVHFAITGEWSFQ
ncbi:hypothetical protein FK268_12760 [Tsukamurella sputi]|uniref:Uncharacterized protein n=1 Tax=Tsukamurella sputi TaxID=2591848 RepID=A0A5C5RKS5_9ACTN|nr:hypothetical protein [Tsukamurella sputi]TWS23184.1 hypothetical protein FK268_12760 [Tsukamurella sputi]